MKIIIVYNHKGGVSKTTTTVNTATFLEAYYGKKVAIIDCDDYQWSTYNNHQREMDLVLDSYQNDREAIEKAIAEKKIVNYDVEKCLVQDFDDKIEEVRSKDYDYVFVDLGNRTLSECEPVFGIADQILIPYSNDEEEIQKAIAFYNLIRNNFPHVQAFCLVVKIEKSRVENHQKIRNILQEKHGLQYYDTIIPLRTRFVKERSFFKPLNFETEKKDFNQGLISFVDELLHKTA
ncbi:ParA family protein [Aquimarina mytili]|uniref:ParA family protein n=1 Tax=Aquimarina mytili TaxID=874423 RepID=A0A937A1V1_9FLAO|nr:ParA family protein [Aquimarina mytili]MBL0686078.1 ParA family protein [Aquimarina mytili]